MNNNTESIDYFLFQNYPNPFNPATKIRFSLPKETRLKINIYIMLGELVETIAEGTYEVGYHKVAFNATSAVGGLPSGLYIYRIESSEYVQTSKMLLLK
ncbi:MAG: T9SS type A sorting domain-containing protein [Ignavibacteriota bacterium]|nr:MAG: T9SS type A sorting domain-containing protein [Ignavibacteriota bacterium]